MGAGFGISGQAFVGADIGGFQGNSNAELFLRWMQYGVLTPFCRNHSEIGNVDQYAWAFGEVVEDHRPRGDQAALPADALSVRAASCRPPKPARRCSGRWSSITSTTRPSVTSMISTCSDPTCWLRRYRPGRDRASGLPARGRLVRLAHRRAFRRKDDSSPPHSDGTDPDLCARRCGHPDVA